MPRQLLNLILLLALLSASSGLKKQTADGQLKTAFQERYGAMKAAMASRDPKAIGALLAPDFQSVDVDGHTQSSEQMMQQLAASPQDPNRVSDTTVLSVEQHENSATVTQRYHMTTTRARPDGQPPQAIEMSSTSIDTWVLSPGGWLIQRTQTDELEVKIDGKVVAHKQRAPKS